MKTVRWHSRFQSKYEIKPPFSPYPFRLDKSVTKIRIEVDRETWKHIYNLSIVKERNVKKNEKKNDHFMNKYN